MKRSFFMRNVLAMLFLGTATLPGSTQIPLPKPNPLKAAKPAEATPVCTTPVYLNNKERDPSSGALRVAFIKKESGQSLHEQIRLHNFITNMFDFYRNTSLDKCETSTAWEKAARASIALYKSDRNKFEILDCMAGIRKDEFPVRISKSSSEKYKIVTGKPAYYSMPANGDFNGLLTDITKIMNTKPAILPLYYPYCAQRAG